MSETIQDNNIPPEYLRIVNRAKLRELSTLLRHKKSWPKHFVWSYTDQYSCAIGLAQGKLHWNPRYALPDEVVDPIFMDLDWKLQIKKNQVQPRHVAAAIDTYLKNGNLGLAAIQPLTGMKRFFVYMGM